MFRFALLLLIALGLGVSAQVQENPEDSAQARAEERLDAPAPDSIRPGGTLAREAEAPPIAPDVRSMRRPIRNYPEQPPVVPHSIRGYQVDKNFNQCLTCHSRSATEATGALMISVTHFLDRDGQVLGAVSPRRYFCLKCHVPQQEVRPIMGNTFKGIDEILQEAIMERESR